MFHHPAVGHPAARRGAGATGRGRRRVAGARTAPGAHLARAGRARLEAEARVLEEVVELFVEVAQDLGEALVELVEDQRAQAAGQVLGAEQADEGRHGRLRAHRAGTPAGDAECGGQGLHALVKLLEGMQELVVEELGGVLAGQVELQLALGHQAERAVVLRRGLGRRLAPGVETALDRFTVPGGQLQRPVAERHDRHAVVLGPAVVVPRERLQAHLLLDRAPEPREHPGQGGDGFAAEGFEQALGIAQRCAAGGPGGVGTGLFCDHAGEAIRCWGMHPCLPSLNGVADVCDCNPK